MPENPLTLLRATVLEQRAMLIELRAMVSAQRATNAELRQGIARQRAAIHAIWAELARLDDVKALPLFAKERAVRPKAGPDPCFRDSGVCNLGDRER